MHRLALASASAALAAGVAVAAHASVSTHALLGLVWSERTNDAKLVQVDPQSLRPTGKRAIVLRGASGLWSFSPDRRRLVLATYRDAEGGNPRASLRFVDARRLRVVRTVPLGRIELESITWTARDRVLVLTTDQLIVVDSSTAEVIDRMPIDGEFVHSARTGQYLIVLRASRGSFDPARLLVVDARGSMRRVVLDDITAGARWVDEVSTHRVPGLAVDPEGERAYVFSPDGLVADVELNTLVVAYHRPLQRRSLLAATKASAGSSRWARWLGDGLVAVSGAEEHAYRDANGFLQVKDQGAGLEIVDTRSWTVRSLHPNARAFSVAGRQVLASAWLWDSATRSTTGIGLAAYTFAGRKRFHLFPGKAVGVYLVFRGRAYVRVVPRLRDEEFLVVDLVRGRVAGTRNTPLPHLLTD